MPLRLVPMHEEVDVQGGGERFPGRAFEGDAELRVKAALALGQVPELVREAQDQRLGARRRRALLDRCDLVLAQAPTEMCARLGAD